MNANKVLQRMANQLHLDVDQLKPEMSLMDDLRLDSLDLVALAMELEQEMGIEIPDFELERMRTVGDVLEFIEKRT